MQNSYKYFLPIKVENLSLYLLSGSFAPANFYDGREKDVQNLFENQLLLSSSNLVGDSDCSIELVLSKVEYEQLTKITDSEDCYLFTGFLPASRLVRVIFKNKKEEEYIRTTINLSTAILTEEQCSSGSLNCSAFRPAAAITCKRSSYDDYIKYQRLLGALALMRIVNEDQYTFNLDYLPFLAQYNEQIEYALANQKISPSTQAYTNKELIESIRKSESESSTALKAISYKDAINSFARKDGYSIKLDSIKHTYDYSSLGGASLVLAYLHDYKVNDLDAGGRVMIDSLITTRFLGVPSASQVAFYYGYSRGYAKFKKKYENVLYKYDFSNRLDRYVAEIVYNISCSKRKTNQFEFLDMLYRQTGSHFALKDGEYMVLGQKIVGKKKAKIGSEEWFEPFYQSLQERCSILYESFESSIAPSLLSILLNNVKTLVQKAISFTIESTKTQREELIQKHKDEIVHLKEEHLANIEKQSIKFEEKERKIRSDFSLLLADIDKNLFDRIDTDGDGVLSYEEVSEFTHTLISIHDEVKKLKASNESAINIDRNEARTTNAESIESTEDVDKMQEIADSNTTSNTISVLKEANDNTVVTDLQTNTDSQEEDAAKVVMVEEVSQKETIDITEVEEAPSTDTSNSEVTIEEESNNISSKTSRDQFESSEIGTELTETTDDKEGQLGITDAIQISSSKKQKSNVLASKKRSYVASQQTSLSLDE